MQIIKVYTGCLLVFLIGPMMFYILITLKCGYKKAIKPSHYPLFPLIDRDANQFHVQAQE